jgi:septum formation protein
MQTVKERTLILASSSPRRQELIRTLRLPVRILASDVDETVEEGMAPADIVEALSLRKAMAVTKLLLLESQEVSGIVIGSDTIVVSEGRILGKPADDEDAMRMLTLLHGQTHQVYSGVACIDLTSGERYISHQMLKVNDNTMYLGDTGQYRVLTESPSGSPEIIVGHTASNVTFRPMSEEEIRSYIKTGEPKDKAGAYGVQGLGAMFIERIEGDFYSVMGLPLNLLYQMLLRFGISPLNQA